MVPNKHQAPTRFRHIHRAARYGNLITTGIGGRTRPTSLSSRNPDEHHGLVTLRAISSDLDRIPHDPPLRLRQLFIPRIEVDSLLTIKPERLYMPTVTHPASASISIPKRNTHPRSWLSSVQL